MTRGTAGTLAAPRGALARDRPRLLLLAFALAALGNLAGLLSGLTLLDHVCKILLLPLLAAWARTRGAPRALLAALGFGWAGDVLLLLDADPAFLAGMGAFAAGHVCYLVVLSRHGSRPRAAWPRALVYAAVLAAVLVVLWGGLPAGLRPPMAGYSALLAAMALAAHRAGPRAALGGGLFLVSDFLIALDVAELPRPQPADLWIMLTYSLAQYLLVSGVLRAVEERSGHTLAYREEVKASGRMSDKRLPYGTDVRP